MRRVLASILASSLAFAAFAPGVAGARPQNAAKTRAAYVVSGDAYDSIDATWTTCPNLANTVTDHTFESAGGGLPGYTSDVDWFKVTVDETGTPVLVNVFFFAGNGGSGVDVFDSDGSRCATTSFDFFREGDTNASGSYYLGSYPTPGWWMSSMAHGYFRAPHPGTFYFRHRSDHLAPRRSDVGRDLPGDAVTGACSFQFRVTVGDADRLAGADRYGTAANLVRMMWNGSEDPWWNEGPWGNAAILASGEDYPDALAATPLSLRSGNPILLTRSGSLPPEVAAEIVRLSLSATWTGNDFTVYVCGSSATISDEVVRQVEALDNVVKVVRIAGGNRFETAAALSDAADDLDLGRRRPTASMEADSVVREAFVVNGQMWADGLGAGPVAGFAHAPLLMCTRTALPPATRDWISDNGVSNVHVIGGPSTVDTSVLDAIASLPTTPTVDRIAGADRWGTAYELARYGIENYNMEPGATLVPSDRPWDALAAGQLSFMTYEPLMLTKPDQLSSYVYDLYDDYGFDYPNYAIGGRITGGTFADFRDLWTRVRPRG